MNYQLKRLIDINPNLAQEFKRQCYGINGCCQLVHKELGPFLNEYMYQDALEILLHEKNIQFQREYYFSIEFHGHQIQHKHYVDFLCQGNILLECKAVEKLGSAQRQQLWNYMRLTKVPIGILYNFSPILDQSEHYYLDTKTETMFLF